MNGQIQLRTQSHYWRKENHLPTPLPGLPPKMPVVIYQHFIFRYYAAELYQLNGCGLGMTAG